MHRRLAERTYWYLARCRANGDGVMTEDAWFELEDGTIVNLCPDRLRGWIQDEIGEETEGLEDLDEIAELMAEAPGFEKEEK